MSMTNRHDIWSGNDWFKPAMLPAKAQRSSCFFRTELVGIQDVRLVDVRNYSDLALFELS